MLGSICGRPSLSRAGRRPVGKPVAGQPVPAEQLQGPEGSRVGKGLLVAVLGDGDRCNIRVGGQRPGTS